MKRQLKLLILLMIYFTTAAANRSAADELLVSAAASLTDAMNEIGRAYTLANPETVVRFNFGASGGLQQQIAQGAPVDVFASASPKEMDALQETNQLAADTRIDFAGNRLVLIVPPGSPLRRWEDLRLPGVRHVAISNPDSVPSGRYAKETLTHRDLWRVVELKAVFGENVRQTLSYVEDGNTDAGIVFATDARIAGRRVRVVDSAIPGSDHSPIVYPAAVLLRAPNGSAARRFTVFLQGPVAQKILERFGFERAPHGGRTPRRGKSPVRRRAA